MDPESAHQEDPNTIPKRTTPTWDMELLLSGATVFALFQGAQGVLAGSAYLLPRLEGDLLSLARILFTYGYGGLILLALTFALHLVIRAYWVALIGMNSVFPAGVKVETLDAGPIAKELLVRRWRSMESNIERADNAATIVFALGVSMVLVLVPISLAVTAMFGVVGLVAWATGLQAYSDWMMTGLIALLFLPYMVAALVDTRRGDRLVPGSLPHRLCRGLLAAYARVGMSRTANPLSTVFASNIGERRGQAIIFVVMLVAMVASTAGLVLSRKDLGFGSYGHFPEPRRGMSTSVEGRSYASSHDADWSPLSPFIPDMVVRGDYLRLVVPFVPELHGHVYERCGPGGEADKAADERRRRAALLACVGGHVTVSLDGQAVALAPEWYTEPRRDLRGLLYMVPVGALPEGRHEVSVLMTPKAAAEAGEDPEQPYLIAFWR